MQTFSIAVVREPVSQKTEMLISVRQNVLDVLETQQNERLL